MGRGLDDLARTTQLPVLAEFPPVAGRRRLPPEAASYLRKPVLGADYGLDPSHTSTASDTWSDPKGATPTRITLSRDVAFDVLPSFVAAPNPTESLSNRTRGLHHHLAPHDDVIVIDSAPVLPVADALTVAPHATGVVFAVSMPDADRRQVASATELLRRVGVRVLGTVATNLDSERRGRNGYGYGAPEATGSSPATVAARRRFTSAARP